MSVRLEDAGSKTAGPHVDTAQSYPVVEQPHPNKTNEIEFDMDKKMIQLRSRIIAAMLKEKHRQNAADLRLAHKEHRLSAYLRPELERIGVFNLERQNSLDIELSRQYCEHIVPRILHDDGLDLPPAPLSIDKPSWNDSQTVTQRTRWPFMARLFARCTKDQLAAT